MRRTVIAIVLIFVIILALLSFTNILNADSFLPIIGSGSEVPNDENSLPIGDKDEDSIGAEDEVPTEGEQSPDQTDLNSILILVNKTNGLPSSYIPSDLTVPDVRFIFEGPHEKQSLKYEGAKALEKLFLGANDEGIILFAVSGYRSYSRQEAIYNSNVQKLGQAETDKISAKPGYSEHQTGLAMDITSQSAGFTLSEAFSSTVEGKWVVENAHKFGFIIRYPKGKEAITGYSFEPWHLRYVGIEAATEIYENGLTLEEYLTN